MQEENYYLHLKINAKDNVTLSVDEDTYSELTGKDIIIFKTFSNNSRFYSFLEKPETTIPQYVTALRNNNFLECDEIRSLAYSFDNVNFQLLMNSEDNTDEVESENEILWGEKETKLLLDKYEQYLSQVGPMKKFKKKKNMWEKISEDIINILNIRKTALQCENRYKTILKRKKKVKVHNGRTGETPETDPFEEELNKIAAIDDSLDPEVKIGVGKLVTIAKRPAPSTSEADTAASSTKKPKKQSLSEVLVDIANKKEEGRDRRHKEKLEFLRQLGERLFNKTNASEEVKPSKDV